MNTANMQPSVLPVATLDEFLQACIIKTDETSPTVARDCSICMETDHATMVGVPCCRQEFHRDCLAIWLEGEEAKGRCPHCRAQLVAHSYPDPSEVLMTEFIEFATGFNRQQVEEDHDLRLGVDESGNYYVEHAGGHPDDRDDESDESDDDDTNSFTFSDPGDYPTWGGINELDYV